MKDAVIAEMHAIKDALSARFGYDPGALVADQIARRKSAHAPVAKRQRKRKQSARVPAMKDPVIAEMHAVKDAISAKHDRDPRKLVAALIARQKKPRKRLIRVPSSRTTAR